MSDHVRQIAGIRELDSFLFAKADQLGSFQVLYGLLENPIARFYKAQLVTLEQIRCFAGVSRRSALPGSISPAPRSAQVIRDLVFLVTEAGGSRVVDLFTCRTAAAAAAEAFEDDHSQLIEEYEASCWLGSADVGQLNYDEIGKAQSRFVWASIGEIDGNYQVSLHSEEMGALAAEARFRLDHAFSFEAGGASAISHAVLLPHDFRPSPSSAGRTNLKL